MSMCSICGSEFCEGVNSDLAAGVAVREIAEKYGVSKSAVSRHNTVCNLRASMRSKIRQEQALTAPGARPVRSTASDLAAELNDLKNALTAELQSSEATGRPLPLNVVRELRNTLELAVKTAVALESRQTESGEERVGRVIYEVNPLCCPRGDEKCKTCSMFPVMEEYAVKAKEMVLPEEPKLPGPGELSPPPPPEPVKKRPTREQLLWSQILREAEDED